MDFFNAVCFVSAIFLGHGIVRLKITMLTVFKKLKVKVSSESGSYTIIELELEASRALVCLNLRKFHGYLLKLYVVAQLSLLFNGLKINNIGYVLVLK